MSDKDDKLEGFADFEQLPPLEHKPSLGDQGDLQEGIDDQGEDAQTAHFVELALNLALAALSGNLSSIMNMPDPERQALIAFLSSRATAPGGMHPGDSGKSIPTPSEEAAAKVVQTPEEKLREQEFLDALGI